MEVFHTSKANKLQTYLTFYLKHDSKIATNHQELGFNQYVDSTITVLEYVLSKKKKMSESICPL